MSSNFIIALRFLTAKKRSMVMSLSCTILGVGLFIITQATTSGFEQFFIKTILGTDGAIRIEDKLQATLFWMDAVKGNNSVFKVLNKEGRKYIEGVEEPKIVTEALRAFPNVAAVSEVLYGSVIIRGAQRSEAVKIYGIDLEQHLKVSDLESQIIRGSLDEYRSRPLSVLIGSEMSKRLLIDVGDSVQIESRGELRRYRVAAVYETGVADIDRVRLYMHIGEARSVLKKATGASFLQVNLFNRDRAPADARHMTEALGYYAKSWQDREKSWLSAFSALQISSAITVSVFTLIAGLAMFNTLAMIVLEKTKDIAILRSMGYERTDITRIFLWQAMIVLAIGIVVGSLFGAAATYAVSRMPLPHGGISGIFATKYFLVDVTPWHFVEAAATAIVTVMIASLIPARRAARLEPGDIVRGTAQ
jgi:lipoprotein-releasing system permease protein